MLYLPASRDNTQKLFFTIAKCTLVQFLKTGYAGQSPSIITLKFMSST